MSDPSPATQRGEKAGTPASNTGRRPALRHAPIRRVGQYELVAPLGSGGMAEVYLARRTSFVGFERFVVVKVIHPHLANDAKFVDMFLDEARLSAQIDHPNVVQVHDL